MASDVPRDVELDRIRSPARLLRAFLVRMCLWESESTRSAPCGPAGLGAEAKPVTFVSQGNNKTGAEAAAPEQRPGAAGASATQRHSAVPRCRRRATLARMTSTSRA